MNVIRNSICNKVRIAALSVLVTAMLVLTSCSIIDTEQINDIIDSTLSEYNQTTPIVSSEGDALTGNTPAGNLQAEGTDAGAAEVISLPSQGRAEAEAKEEFTDDYDRRAAAIIDDAIWMALDNTATVEYRNYSAEIVNSKVQYPFEKYCERMEDRTAAQLELFDLAYEKALDFEEFEVTKDDYSGSDLIIDSLTIATDWDYYDPYLNNYFTIDLMQRDSISSCYFDPEKDANFRVFAGTAEFDDMLDKMKVFDAVVSRIVRKMPDNLSTLNKYYYLACVVANRCHYSTPEEIDSKQARNSHTAYGALINGSAVCEGYSKAFLLLCEKAGLFCEIVSGMGGGEGHMWNLTELETGTLNTDVTWSDAHEPGSGQWLDYFMMSDDELEYFDHVRVEGHTASSEAIWK